MVVVFVVVIVVVVVVVVDVVIEGLIVELWSWRCNRREQHSGRACENAVVDV